MLAIGVGVAAGAIPDSNGVIHACYHVNGQGQLDSDADLRVIDPTGNGNADTKACKRHEAALDWNQAGAQGPQGPQGAQGDTGPQGPKGDTGPAGADAPRVFARLNADGSIAASSPSVVPNYTGKFTFTGSVGQYQVGFNQDVEGCVAVANMYGSGNQFTNTGDAGYAVTSFTSHFQVGVIVFGPDGRPKNASFNLIVAC